MAVPEHVDTPPTPDRIIAVVTLGVATTLVRTTPFRFTLGLARAAKCCTTRAATVGEAQEATTARDWASRFFPGRAACLELSLAAFLFTAVHGRSVDWCIGCRFDPCESHAWIESANQSIAEPNTPDRPFHTTLRI